MINKNKFIKTYIVMYFIMVLAISYTAMNSPYMAKNYHLNILFLSLVVWLTSYYVLGFKRLVILYKDAIKRAKARSAIRKHINDELKKRS